MFPTEETNGATVRTLSFHIPVCLMLAFGLGCSGQPLQDPNAARCSEGESRPCLCAGEYLGSQLCQRSGLNWHPCNCQQICQLNRQCAPQQVCTSLGLCGNCSDRDPCDAGLLCLEGACLPQQPPQWYLTIDSDDWEGLAQRPKDHVPCKLVVNSVDYSQGCQVRFRGGTSLEYPKKSFRIKFPEDSAHPGYTRKINLRSEYNDPSYLRTALAYQTFRRLTTIPTPRSRFIRLYLNGTYYGLMQEVERVGNHFLKRRGREGDNSLYEADPPHPLYLAGSASFLPLPDMVTYYQAYDKKCGSDSRNDLQQLVEEAIWPDYLDGAEHPDLSTSRLRRVLDWDLFVDYLAVMAIIQNHDHVKKNFYFSLQRFTSEQVRWEFYPWDLDLSYGCLWQEQEASTLCQQMESQREYDLGKLYGGPLRGYPDARFFNLLIHQFFADPELKTLFEYRVCTMLNSQDWQHHLPNMATALHSYLAQSVAADELDLNPSSAHYDGALADLLSFFAARQSFLQTSLTCSRWGL